MTNAHIGNYGAFRGETESKDIKISGLVVKNYTVQYSRRMTEQSIQDYLLDENLVVFTAWIHVPLSGISATKAP